jgi:hypothetical protein
MASTIHGPYGFFVCKEGWRGNTECKRINPEFRETDKLESIVPLFLGFLGVEGHFSVDSYTDIEKVDKKYLEKLE